MSAPSSPASPSASSTTSPSPRPTPNSRSGNPSGAPERTLAAGRGPQGGLEPAPLREHRLERVEDVEPDLDGKVVAPPACFLDLLLDPVRRAPAEAGDHFPCRRIDQRRVLHRPSLGGALG